MPTYKTTRASTSRSSPRVRRSRASAPAPRVHRLADAGRSDTADRITSWDQFRRCSASSLYPACYLWYAVRGFFENGGKDCYVAARQQRHLRDDDAQRRATGPALLEPRRARPARNDIRRASERSPSTITLHSSQRQRPRGRSARQARRERRAERRRTIHAHDRRQSARLPPATQHVAAVPRQTTAADHRAGAQRHDRLRRSLLAKRAAVPRSRLGELRSPTPRPAAHDPRRMSPPGMRAPAGQRAGHDRCTVSGAIDDHAVVETVQVRRHAPCRHHLATGCATAFDFGRGPVRRSSPRSSTSP